MITKRFRKLATHYGQCLVMVMLVVMLIATCNVHASTDQENETLAQLLTELQLLETLIKTAQQSSIRNDRQQFDYDALRRDIELVIQGINDHLTMTRRNPRALPPLQGAYRQ